MKHVLKKTAKIVLILWVFYLVHVISFAEGFNLSTDRMYDRIHNDLITKGISVHEMLFAKAHGDFNISYEYVYWRVIPNFDLKHYHRIFAWQDLYFNK